MRKRFGCILAFATLVGCDSTVSGELGSDFEEGERDFSSTPAEPADSAGEIANPPADGDGQQTDGDGATVAGEESTAFNCVADAVTPPSQSLTLTKRQLENTLEDLFGSGALTAANMALAALPDEVFDDVSHVRQSTISEAKVESYHRIAVAVAQFVTDDDARTAAIFGDCAIGLSPDAACLDAFLDGFARRIFRRPLTESEEGFVRDLMATGSGSHRERLRASLAYLLSSPHFIWRLEVGQLAPDGALRLTSHEVATRLAYTFTDTTPDAALHQRAEAGKLNALSAVRDEARRLLSTDRGREKLTAAIARWSLTDRTADLSTLPPEIMGSLDPDALSSAMIEEAQRFIETMVFERNASFEELLTSDLSFAEDPDLADLYGHAPASPGVPATFSGRRRGLLLRAPLLTSTGPRAHIINRGVDVQLRFLCNEIPEPNVDIAEDRGNDAPTEAERLSMSNRDVVSSITAPAVCQSCHSTINPTGYVFESFDSIGRLRDSEMIFDSMGELHGEASIDTAADVPLPQGGVVPMNDAYDFVGWVAQSDVGKACFARNMLRYLTERAETVADECNLAAAVGTISSSTTPIVDLVVEATVHDDFLIKRLEQ